MLLCQFSVKSKEKVACEKTYQSKLEFYNTDRKMKNSIRRIFISIIMHPNFMYFYQKISFKSVLKIFTPVYGQLRTALRNTTLAKNIQHPINKMLKF